MLCYAQPQSFMPIFKNLYQIENFMFFFFLKPSGRPADAAVCSIFILLGRVFVRIRNLHFFKHIRYATCTVLGLPVW